MTPVRTMIAVVLLCAVATMAASVYAAHKMERCVAAVMQAHRQSISSWEAAVTCERPREDK